MEDIELEEKCPNRDFIRPLLLSTHLAEGATERKYKKYHNRDFIHPLDISTPYYLPEGSPPPEDDATVRKCIVSGCSLVGLITENLLIHPFIVLRRQCQVSPGSTKYHLEPFTLIPVMVHLYQSQGLNTLWKGIGSVLLVKGMTLAIEDLISKVTPWPKEVDVKCNSVIAFGQHILLKCVSIGIVTPFYSASLVETVQSEIASEIPGILDVFRNGALRLVEINNKGRLIPIYALLPPTIAYEVTKYLFCRFVRSITKCIMIMRLKHRQKYAATSDGYALSETLIQDIELQSIPISMCATDVIFYPIETVIHRLHLQGTRTIIDNLDTGRSVTPLLTGYNGATDCYHTIISTEGPLGLYKGFGALILQFGVYDFVIRATKWILTELITKLKPKPKR